MSWHDKSPGATPETVARFRTIAGDGTLDERCRRILAHSAGRWWGTPEFVSFDRLIDTLEGRP